MMTNLTTVCRHAQGPACAQCSRLCTRPGKENDAVFDPASVLFIHVPLKSVIA